jgi:hypothetical protein
MLSGTIPTPTSVLSVFPRRHSQHLHIVHRELFIRASKGILLVLFIIAYQRKRGLFDA